MVGCAVLLGSGSNAQGADAVERATCIEAATKAQSFLDNHKLLAAREQLLVCGRASCPSAVVKDCVNWLREAEENTPAIVFSVRGVDGVDLASARVTVDGAPISGAAEGNAIEVDPGLHAIRFELPGYESVERRVLAASGDKHVVVEIRLSAAPVAPVAPVPDAAQPTPDRGPVEPAPADGSRGVPTERRLAYAAAAVSVVSVGIGAAFGIDAIEKHNELACRGNVCDATALSDGRVAATGSDIAFVAGAVFAATAIALFVFPRGHDEVRVAPGHAGIAMSARGAPGLEIIW
jgi:hypothetical protein